MEEERKVTTVKDVLIDVNRILRGIMVPVTHVESIGIPVARAINGIQLCIDEFMKHEMAEEQTEQEAEQPEVQEDA